jgi:3-deoxy-D-manno-octulosonate 8-phosphate phosphatase (KDO 8-P phosphatase)
MKIAKCKMPNNDIKRKASRIRCILLDVDGTLTDGQLIFGPNEEAYKSFNIKDGMGIHLARMEGIEVGLISGRYSPVVARRAKDLEIQYLWQGVKDKLALFREILKELGLHPEEVAFMGDDVNDLPLLREVGLSAAVHDAVEEVREHVDYITERDGGKGAVREFIDFIRAENLKPKT